MSKYNAAYLPRGATPGEDTQLSHPSLRCFLYVSGAHRLNADPWVGQKTSVRLLSIN